MKKVLAILVVGLAGGGAAGWFGHAHLGPGLNGEGDEVEAQILGERVEEERVVLTLGVDERTLLVSFRERREDVAALVAPGDTIVLRVPPTGPFADDPQIVEVRRAEAGPRDGDSSEGDAADGDASEGDGDAGEAEEAAAADADPEDADVDPDADADAADPDAEETRAPAAPDGAEADGSAEDPDPVASRAGGGAPPA